MAKAKKAVKKKAVAKKKPATARAAKKTTAARTKKQPAAKRTSQNKFVIEGVPPLEVGLSALAALASALETMGADISYETLLVASGEAFRLYVQTGRPRSSGHAGRPLAGVAVEANTFATENLVDRACQALGIQAEVVALKAKPSATRLKAIWKAIEKQVRSGVPVPACGCPGSFQHEWCLITGLDPQRHRVFFRDMTHRFELYGQGPAGDPWKGWMPGPDGEVWVPHVLIKAVRKGRTTEKRLAEAVIAGAVEAAAEGLVEPDWVSGPAAYDVWRLHLGQDRWHSEAANHLREPALANSWLLLNAFAGRRAAGNFLARVARHFAGRKNAAVHKAAKLYSAAAGALQTAGALFPNWGQGYEEADRRAHEIELLGIAAKAERDAVAALAEAFDS